MKKTVTTLRFAIISIIIFLSIFALLTFFSWNYLNYISDIFFLCLVGAIILLTGILSFFIVFVYYARVRKKAIKIITPLPMEIFRSLWIFMLFILVLGLLFSFTFSSLEGIITLFLEFGLLFVVFYFSIRYFYKKQKAVRLNVNKVPLYRAYESLYKKLNKKR